MRKIIVLVLIGIFTSCSSSELEEKEVVISNCAEFKGYRIVNDKRTYEFLLEETNELVFVSVSDVSIYLSGTNKPPHPKIGDVICSDIFKKYM